MRFCSGQNEKTVNGERAACFFYPDVNRAFISSGDYSRIGGIVEVDKKTVGQYTGLTDKNGKRVFEGDILQFENDDGEFSLYSCEWGEEICGWIIRFLEYDAPCDAFDAQFCMDAQVIGNIHDNPELVEV